MAEIRGDLTHGLEQAYNYPIFPAIVQRRSRRFRLGMEIPVPPLKYKSDKTIVPLTKSETALLCFAGAGSSGLSLSEVTPGIGSNILVNWSSRTFPSPCANHRTRLLFTNDEGVYLYNPREAENIVEPGTLGELEERIQSFDQEVVKIRDGRLDLPRKTGVLWRLNVGTANAEGQTLFLPVVDPAYELIVMALVTMQYEHWLFYDDATGKPAGVEKWIDKLKLTTRVPISMIDQYATVACSLEAAFITQNMLLMAQAMGLGAFPFSGFIPIILMGGTPATRGLGFRFTTDKKKLPNPVGIDGLIEGFCPPYKTMDEAVDAVVERKFGSCGIFTSEARPTPFLDQTAIAENLAQDRIPEDIIQCTKDFCNYIYETYGRFPAFADTMSIPIAVGMHHIDTDFYRRFYKPGAVSENQEKHMATWH